MSAPTVSGPADGRHREDKLVLLLSRLDAAVDISDCKLRCQAIKQALAEVTAGGADYLPERFLAPSPGTYARRLVHKDPQERYSVLAMVWDRGQGTPLHDHHGRWCVECVYRGRIKVVSYSRQDAGDDPELARFARETEVFAGPGEAGALIPPFEYHTLENAEPNPAITVHVYAGELDECAIFLPEGDAYRRHVKSLSYTA